MTLGKIGNSIVRLRLSKQIAIHTNTLQKLYQALETLQVEAAVTRSERQGSSPLKVTYNGNVPYM